MGDNLASVVIALAFLTAMSAPFVILGSRTVAVRSVFLLLVELSCMLLYVLALVAA